MGLIFVQQALDTCGRSVGSLCYGQGVGGEDELGVG